MRGNPLVTEVIAGLNRPGYAHFYYLGALALQAGVLFVMWPKGGVDELLAGQHSPYTLAAVVMAMGLAMAYCALRAGNEEILLRGQHGLRDWALATPLGLGRILRGYVLGQIVQSLNQLALSAPLLLVAFTVSGGEWAALAACVGAALIQAVFYRLCGAITHLTLGQHGTRSLFAIRTLLAVVYVPVGWLVPVTSHLVLSYRALGESPPAGAAFPAGTTAWVFMATYAGLGTLAALMVYRLLLRERRRMAGPPDRASLEEVVT